MMRIEVIRPILGMPRTAKRAVALLIDALCCAGAVVFAYYLRLGDWGLIDDAVVLPMVVSVLCAVPAMATVGLYRTIFRHSGRWSTLAVARAVFMHGIVFAGAFTFYGLPGVPRTVGLIQPILLFVLASGWRTAAQLVLSGQVSRSPAAGAAQRYLIYGAGSSGRQLAEAMRSSPGMQLVGFVDDDPRLHRATIDNVAVYRPSSLQQLAKDKGVTDILLAIPSAPRARRAEIVAQLRQLNLSVRTLPGLIDIARGEISVNDLREINIEDLLGRDPVAVDFDVLDRTITDKIVLVTGAGGSIGSELCRQIARQRPAMLLLVEINEYNLYSIHDELSNHDAFPATHIVSLLASVTDERRMDEIFATWTPNIVFHAAAYKHVPIVEHNIIEGIRNNAIGTYTVARLSKYYGVSDFVLISTDKAVRPTNAMGASKRFSEMILQAFHDDGSKTCFSMVRFGNVLGSSGSVVPLFLRQIASGGPITITDLEITRYFMTIPEAAQLVLHAAAMARGGDVFVLDMGEPVKIIDLARNLIELSGLSVRSTENPEGDIEIRVIGLRPGEKLYEELLIGNNPVQTSHPRIMRAHEQFATWDELSELLRKLEAAIAAGDAAQTQQLLRAAVNDYRPNSALVDWISTARAELDAAAAR